jgi:hypothetical protein
VLRLRTFGGISPSVAQNRSKPTSIKYSDSPSLTGPQESESVLSVPVWHGAKKILGEGRGGVFLADLVRKHEETLLGCAKVRAKMKKV